MAVQLTVGLLVLLCCASTVLAAQSTPYIYVRNATEARDDPSCWFGGQDNPCRTLGFALEGIHNTSNSTRHPAVFLEGGEYELNEGSATVFNGTLNPDLKEIGIIGSANSTRPGGANHPSVIIHCKGYVGLTFINVPDIIIEHVEFVGCGAMQRSTSRNITDVESFSFAKFQVGLHFVFCKNILFTDVWVIHSPGTGVVIYASAGKNTFENSQFKYNRIPAKSPQYPGGGGLYLEFPYCSPVVEDDCDEHVSPNFTSNTTYLFSHCKFYQNNASVTNVTNTVFILPQKREHIAFGRGGGFSVFFKGRAQNNTVTVNQCTFEENEALWGAGMFAEFQDNAASNKLRVYKSNLTGNTITNDEGGGGTRLGFLFFEDGHAHDNQILFDGCNFERNTAYWGGGVSFYTAREQGTPYATNTLEFTNCFWSLNKAKLGAAIDLSVWHAVDNGSTVQVQFTNTTILFHQNVQTPGSLVGIGALYIDSIPTAFIGYVNFSSNLNSAVAATGTSINFLSSCIATFTANRGRYGGAIALLGSAFIRTYNGTQLNFTNNSATLKGGAIYSHSIGEHELLSSRNCFIRFSPFEVTPYNWTAYFYFKNNTANGKVNSIYTTTLLPCVWGGAYGPYSPTGWKINTTDVLCWNSTHWKYPTSNGNCSNEIETAPAMFNSSTYSMNAYPGQLTELPISTFDDLNNAATGRTVFTANSQDPSNAQVDSTSSYIADNSIKLYGTPDDTETQIDLYTLDPRVMYMTVNVTLRPCPPGLIPKITDDMTACECGGDYNGIVYCNQDEFQSQLELQGTWLGYHGNSRHIVGGYSPYTFSTETKLPQNVSDLDAHFYKYSNRRGTLCGECQDGYGPALNSHAFECVKCSEEDTKYHWVFFILSEILPVTILFAILLVFNISLTSGPANAFIFFAQVITSSFGLYTTSVSDYNIPREVYTVLYDIANLNFFDAIIPSYCVQSGMKTASVISLDYVVAVWPVILIALFRFVVWMFDRGVQPLHYLCQPLQVCFARCRKKWNLKSVTSISDVFAAFLLLSYVKFTTVSIRLLSFSYLYDDTARHVSTVMYYDGNISYFHTDHAVYAALAIFVLVVFVIVPPVLFLVYPGCSRSNVDEEPDKKCVLYLKNFFDIFYGCYKNGTEGTKDFRRFAGLYFVGRIAFLALNLINISWAIQYLIQQILCIVAILLFTLARPYKNDFYNHLDATIFGILATINALSSYNYQIADNPSPYIFALEYILIWLPMVYMVGFLFHRCCCWRRSPTETNGYVNLAPFDDSICRHSDDREPLLTKSQQSVQWAQMISSTTITSALASGNRNSSSHEYGSTGSPTPNHVQAGTEGNTDDA